jgi:hypothetical protein
LKIAIVSAIWERKELTEIFLSSLQRYEKDYGIRSAVAGSEGVKTREMCLDYGVAYVETPNKPISGKFIKASQLANIAFKPDAFLILGSDDFIDDALIQCYLKALEKGVDIAGLVDCYFYHTGSKEAMHWVGYTNFRKGETIGMARMLSKKVFNKLHGKMWPGNMNSGLDFTMMKKLKHPKMKNLLWQSFHIEGMIAVDIKGQGNISGFDCYRANMKPVDISIFDTIPEFKRIKKL